MELFDPQEFGLPQDNSHVDEFDDELNLGDDFEVNDIVDHKQLGFGKVVKVNSDWTCSVLFKVGERTVANNEIEFVDNGDERDIDFDYGYPVDAVPFEVEGDDQEHQRMLMRVEWKTWKFFVGKSIVHPRWGKGIITKYVRERPEGATWTQVYFIMSFEGHGEERVPLNTLVESLRKHN